jgi:transcriptional regulator of arginine metabolism
MSGSARMNNSIDSRDRLSVLKSLLLEGKQSTQEELREELLMRQFEVNQSTISRDLKRLGAIKGSDAEGRTIYKLSEESASPLVPENIAQGLKDLVLSIEDNGSLIVIHTTPGSASLIARHLDSRKPANILGTIAGDDTIFVAPRNNKEIHVTLEKIRNSF